MDDLGITIIRSRRRTIGLHIGSDARLTVRAPLRASQRAIASVVTEKRAWIQAKLAMMRQRLSERPAPIPPKFVREYRKQALQIITSRVQHYAEHHEFAPQRVKVNGAQRRWGSCSHRGSLNFSYRLIFAPLSVIDYVVVHELAHLKHPNHSRHFWACVASMMPEFRIHHRWLKEHGHRL